MLQGLNIIGARKDRKLSIEQAYGSLNMSRQRAARIESGKTKASLPEIEAIIAANGLSIVLLSDSELRIMQEIESIIDKNAKK